MGFRLKIEGGAAIELKEQSITSVRFRTDIPQDSNARSTDLGSTVEITGKILTAVDGEPFDATRRSASGRLCRRRRQTATERLRSR